MSLRGTLRPASRIGVRTPFERRSGGPGVLSVFANGEKGFYVDAYSSTLHQDSAATTPVTASGDPIGRITDLSPNAAHFSQATAGSRPTLLVEGSMRFIRPDGVDDSLDNASLVMNGATGGTVVVAFRQRRISPLGGIFVHGTTTANSVGLLENNGSLGTLHGIACDTSLNFQHMRSTYDTSVQKMVVCTIKVDPSQGVQADRVKMRVNGYDVDTTVTSSAGAISSVIFDTAAATIGKVATNFSNADISAVLYVGRLLTDAEVATIESLFMRRNYNTSAYTEDDWDYSRPLEDRINFPQTTALASVTYETDATSVDVSGFVSDAFFTNFPTLCKIGVLVNGVYNQQVSPGVDGAFGPITATLPAGTKQVTIVNSPQSYVTGQERRRGAYVTSLVFNSSTLRRITHTTLSRMVLVGDSILTGQAADPVHQFSWAVQLRGVRSGATGIEGVGTWALRDLAQTTALRSRTVGFVSSHSPQVIYLAIGTNDYGLNLWNAASFGTAYAALLDAIHAALPNAVIFCQTPILRTTETANGSGSTLGDYRTQITTAVSTRTGYCTLVDGTAILALGDLSDGLHPSTAGHTKYFNYVRALPGIL